MAAHHPARRPADLRRVRRMSARAQAGHRSLFAAAGLDRDAPRPLADRLRPRSFAEVVGQDHLLGPDGALTRMLETRSLGSLIFWGPPGTGKTTVARLLADATALHFEQISAVFSGVADLKKVFDAARARRETGQRHAAVRRRGASLQPRAAGLVPAGDGGRHRGAGRRDHGKSVVRAQRRAAVARPRAGVPAARRRGDRKAAGARRGDRGHGRCRSTRRRAPRWCAWPTATAAPRSRSPRRCGARRAPGEIFDAAQLQEVVQRRAPIYDKSQDGHYNLISALHKSVRGSDPDAALYYLCRMLDAGERPALSRAPRGAHGGRGHRARRSAGAGDRQRRQGCL